MKWFFVKQEGRSFAEQCCGHSGCLPHGQHEDALLLRSPVHRSLHYWSKLWPKHESRPHVHIRDRSPEPPRWTRHHKSTRRDHRTSHISGSGHRTDPGHQWRLAFASWTSHLPFRVAAPATSTLSRVTKVRLFIVFFFHFIQMMSFFQLYFI